MATAPETPEQSKEAKQNFEDHAKKVLDEGRGRIDKFNISEKDVGKGREARAEAKSHLEARIQALKERSAERVTRNSLASLKEEVEKDAKEYLDAIEALMVKAAKRELSTDAEKGGKFVLNDKERQDFFALIDGLDKLNNNGITPAEKALFLSVSRAESASDGEIRQISDLMAKTLDKDSAALTNYEKFREKYHVMDAGINVKFMVHDDFIRVLKPSGYAAMLDVIETAALRS